MSRLWTAAITPDAPGITLASSLVVAGDLLLVSDATANTVHALNTAPDASCVDRRVWTSRVGSQMGVVTSRLVWVGSYAYLITQSLPYVHRIALDSGRRQLLSIREGERMEMELAALPSRASPVVVEDGHIALNLDSGESLLLVLTAKGAVLLALSPDPRAHFVRGHVLGGDLAGPEWTTPAVCAGWAVATSSDGHYLPLEIASLDDDVAVSPRRVNADYDTFTECAAITDRANGYDGGFVWLAKRRQTENWDIVILRPPNTIDTIPLPGLRRPGLPIIDGDLILVPGSDEEDRQGLWRVFPKRHGVLGLQPNEFLPYAGAGFAGALSLFRRAPGQLIGVGEQQAFLVNTHAGVGSECISSRTPPYATSGSYRAHSATLAGSRLFVGWDGFVTCYELV